MVSRGFGLAALAATGLLLTAADVRATPPEDRSTSTANTVLAAPLPTMGSVATTPLFAPPVVAKRSRDRNFDTSMGEVDPRKRQLPRTHRFRLAIHAQSVGLPKATDSTGERSTKFHFAPLMLDAAYQAQFLKYAMVRLAVAAGPNVANTRQAMPVAIFPQAYVGVQTRIVGLAFGYGFDVVLPPNYGVTDGLSNSFQQPVIRRNHVIMGELSATTRIDRVALTFALTLGGIQSMLNHYPAENPERTGWRFYLGLQAGVFFDGSIRRARKARKQAAR